MAPWGEHTGPSALSTRARGQGTWSRVLAPWRHCVGTFGSDAPLHIGSTIVVMQTPTNAGAAGAQSPHHPRDVVAGLVNDGMAALVAGAAVREAVHRAARVRFIQVLPVDLSSEDRAEMDVAMFGVALRALHRQRRVPCTV